MIDLDILPPSLHSFLTITELDSSRAQIASLFARKFGDPPPDIEHHLAALYTPPDGSMRLLCYSHMRPFGDIFLSGGSCSDGDVIRMMNEDQREALRAAGGAWHWVLKYAFAKFADRCDAFFGYSGDARALEVCRSVDFLPTEHAHLIVHWHKPLPDAFKRALTAKAHALGPF